MKADSSAVKLVYDNKDISRDVAAGLLSFSYVDKEDGEADEINIQLEDTAALWKNGWYPDKGATLEASLYADGQSTLKCGTFTIDEIEASGPPDTVTIKALSDSVKKDIKTKRSAAHESKTFRQIAQSVADKHGYKLQGDIPDVIFGRVTQHRKSDVQFLHGLAATYGFAFTIKGNLMVFTSIYSLEAGKAVTTIDRSQLISYSYRDKSADTYKDAKVDYHDPATGKVVSSEYSIDDLANNDNIHFSTLGDTATNTLQINDKCENEQQAKAKAKAGLYNANTKEQTLDLVLLGKTLLVAGVNFKLTGMGVISGMYHIIKSTHTKTKSGGYTTRLECKKVARVAASETKATKAPADTQVKTVNIANNDKVGFTFLE